MKRKLVFIALFIVALMLLVSGTFLSIYSFSNNITFKMMGSNISGFIFGLVAIFLSVRYMFSLERLKKKIEQSDAKFSWDNFRENN